MQIEIYNMIPIEDKLSITLEAVRDSFSSLLWDIEYYACGVFEVYIAASPKNIEIFRTGRIVGRDDDKDHYGLIESVQLETDAEDGDYLIVSGRFLMCLLERRIIYPTFNFTKKVSYAQIVNNVVYYNACRTGARKIPGLSIGDSSGSCWNQNTKLQISYDNLMKWVYTICEKIGGTANIRLAKTTDEQYEKLLELSEGTDRSILQDDNPHIVFSDGYNKLLSFSYSTDSSVQRNYAYILGKGEGEERKRTTYCDGDEPEHLDRYEVYVDERNTAQEEDVTDAEYLEILKSSGAEHLVQPKTASESAIAAFSTQYQYNKDYFVGDYVTVEQKRFGLIQPRIQLIGMVESFDQNGRSLTPTFKETE